MLRFLLQAVTKRSTHRLILLLAFSIVISDSIILTASPARADTPYYFIKTSCDKELNLFSIQTFMLWNVCDRGCSTSSQEEMSTYNLTDVGNKQVALPNCDLGFGQMAEVTLSDYRISNSGIVRGTYSVKVNGREAATLSHEKDNNLRIHAWMRENYNSKTNERSKSPRVDVNLCTSDGRTSIGVPKRFECSSKEVANEGKSVPNENASNSKDGSSH